MEVEHPEEAYLYEDLELDGEGAVDGRDGQAYCGEKREGKSVLGWVSASINKLPSLKTAKGETRGVRKLRARKR